VAGPIIEVNLDLMAHGRKGIGPIHAFMTIEREGQGQEANAKAVNAIFIPSHIPDLMNILKMQREQLDIESNIPSWTMGNAQPLGEAFRTSSNMSAMSGGANMVTKDYVRAFDRFTSGVIGSMLKWNMDFNPNEEIKGDFSVRAKGNISLVAKEVRGAAIEQMIATMTEEDRVMFDMYGLNLDRLKARDLPTDRLLTREEATAAVDSLRQSRQEGAAAEQGLTTAKAQRESAQAQKLTVDAQLAAQTADAVMREILSRIDNNLAQAKSQGDRNQLENLKLLMQEASNVPSA
jgi:hypothetical protein